jgi:hypothetical protein
MKNWKLRPVVKILNQKELIKLKSKYAERLHDIERNIDLAKTLNNQDDLINLFDLKTKILKQQQIIKNKIAKNNFLFGINKLIFKRESLNSSLMTLKRLVKGEKKQTKLFKELKDKNFNSQFLIKTITEKIRIVEKKMERRNNNIKSILMFNTI